MNRAVFLDRDGTINSDKGYLYKIEDFLYLPGVKEGLKILQEAGFMLVIVTNQSGIARGYYTEDDFTKLNQWMLDDLSESEIFVTDVLYCPHHPQGMIEVYRKKCRCRKPEVGLFIKAATKHEIDISRSYIIGDKPRDVVLCLNGQAAPQGYLLYSDMNDNKIMEGNITHIKGGLLEAAKDIVERENGKMDQRDHK